MKWKVLSTIYGALMVPKLAATWRNNENIEEKHMSISGIENPGPLGLQPNTVPPTQSELQLIIIETFCGRNVNRDQ